jgi:hypothetical protein
MASKLCTKLIAALFLGCSSSCVCWDQFNHSVRRMSVDYNSWFAPAITFEQEDHLPYPAPQVGYYRWMYDKDPGHQLAALGPVPQPACCVPQVVPPGDNPFEYQVEFPNAISYQTDGLWGPGQPEPINVSQAPGDASNGAPPAGKTPPPLMTVPTAPLLPQTDGGPSPPPGAYEPARSLRAPIMQPTPTLPGQGQPGSVLPGSTLPGSTLPGAPIPGFGPAPSQPKPVDEDLPPMLGPASQSDPNLRLTTSAPAPATSSAPPTGLWPR